MNGTSYAELKRRLADVGQLHLLQFWNELTGSQQAALASQLAELDWTLIGRLRDDEDAEQSWGELAARAVSPPAFRPGQSNRRWTRDEAVAAAEEQLREGTVGAVLVAGGQGTRLGFPHPKGIFPIGPVSQRSLFQMHVDQLRAVADRYGKPVPLYLMTSPATHDETVEYFQRFGNFGLADHDLHFFCQGTMPALDDSGHLLLEARDRVFLSPDGHGGMLAAFVRHGCLADADRRGLRQLFYFQVDNPLVSICDRELIGYHVLSESEMSTLVVAKTRPSEKVGNVVSIDGRLMVIEYSDLPDEVARRRDADGNLALWAGNIAVHVFQIEFLRRAAASDRSLPFHRARKKVPFVNADGQVVEPDKPNATKYEKFIFDLMPFADNAIVVEGEAAEIFAPLKNASGASTDTPESTRAALVARARRWLESAGAQLAPGIELEISPALALDAAELRRRLNVGVTLTESTYLERQP